MLNYSELKSYLVGNSSQETVDLINDAINVFDQFALPEYMEAYDICFGENSDQSDTVIVDNLIGITSNYLDSIIRSHGVFLIDDLMLRDKVNIAAALCDIAHYNDKTVLYDTLNQDTSIAEIFSELMSLITGYEIEDVLPLIVRIDPSFVSNFKDYLGSVDTVKIDERNISLNIEAFKKLKYKINGASTYADRYLINPNLIGLEFDEYFNQYYKDSEFNEKMQPIDNIAIDLVGLALLSKDGFNNPLISIRKRLNDLFTEIKNTTNVDIAINKLIRELSRG